MWWFVGLFVGGSLTQTAENERWDFGILSCVLLFFRPEVTWCQHVLTRKLAWLTTCIRKTTFDTILCKELAFWQFMAEVGEAGVTGRTPGCLCVLCGLPAVGKSTLARTILGTAAQHGWRACKVSYDDLIPEDAFQITLAEGNVSQEESVSSSS